MKRSIKFQIPPMLVPNTGKKSITLINVVGIVSVLVLMMIASSCNMGPKKDPIPVTNEKLDTILTPAASISATPALFETAFIRGTTQKINKSTISLTGITIGSLTLPTGKIIACDPLHIDEYGLPFTRVFPTGTFPVQLSIASLDNDERIAFGRILFSEAPVAKWELAVLEGQTTYPVGAEEIQGYSVDAGVVVLMDDSAKKVLNKNGIENLDNQLFAEMNKHYHHKWRFAMFNYKDANVAAYTTGFGDGRYATYIGYDSGGRPCRLLTDFEIFDWKQSKTR